jgi:hypothetical protein
MLAPVRKARRWWAAPWTPSADVLCQYATEAGAMRMPRIGGGIIAPGYRPLFIDDGEVS